MRLSKLMFWPTLWYYFLGCIAALIFATSWVWWAQFLVALAVVTIGFTVVDLWIDSLADKHGVQINRP